MHGNALHGRSLVETPEGELLTVSESGGLYRMEPALWSAYRDKMLGNIGRTVEDLLTGHPERRMAFGLTDGASAAALSLERLLGAPDTTQ